MDVPIEELKSMLERALAVLGYSAEEIPVISDVILYAQLRDSNQGIVKLVDGGYVRGRATGEIRVARETRISALIDGGNNPAMVVLNSAVDICLQKTRVSGFSVIGTFGTSQSTGAMGYYVRRIALSGYIGYASAGSAPSVCAHGGCGPVFGTNPIAVGIPCTPRPLVLDMATSAMTRYGLIEADVARRPIPCDVAYNAEGSSTTNASEALKGAIRPFDRGPKGSGLSMIVEILTGPLVSASYCGLEAERGRGNLVIGLDPQLLGDAGCFREEVATLLGRVKGCARLPGVDEILAPGEKEEAVADRRLRSGRIDINERQYEMLERLVTEA